MEIDSEDGTSPPNLVYTHRLVPGIMKLEHYGLKLARVTAISDDILQSAEEIMKTLTSEWKVKDIRVFELVCSTFVYVD